MDSEIKKEMNLREQPDSFTVGSAAKGGALKVYFNLEDVEATQKKIDNFFKTKEYVMQKYGIAI